MPEQTLTVSLSMSDLNTLEYFRYQARPRVPVGRPEIWTHNVAARAHTVSLLEGIGKTLLIGVATTYHGCHPGAIR